MPTYEYKCRDCGESLEVVQSITEDPLTVCPHCKGDLRKVFHPVGIAFKGSGFYKTDNRSSNGKAKSTEPTTESTSSESKPASSSSDSKPADTASPAKSTEKKATPAKK